MHLDESKWASILTKAYFEEHRLRRKRSFHDIGNEIGASHKVVSRHFHATGLTDFKRTRKSKSKIPIGRDFLYEQHVVQKRSALDIAKEIGVSTQTILDRLRRLGIDVQSTSPSRKGQLGQSRFTWIKNNALLRGYDFKISYDDAWKLFIEQDQRCALSGQPIHFSPHRTGGTTASLDRIDNNLGYVLGNLWWVHKDINRGKGTLSTQEYVQLCQMVANHASTRSGEKNFVVE